MIQERGSALRRVEEALRRLEKHSDGRGQWQCPAHNDRTPSLSIQEKEDGVGLKCFAGCSTEEITNALGLKVSELFDDSKESQLVATYQYTDADGNPIRSKLRHEPWYDKGARKKKRLIWRALESGRLHDEVTLYRLPAVMEAISLDRVVYLGEGEKAADRITRAGQAGTCAADKKWKVETVEILRGARVVYIADNDPAGAGHALDAYKALQGIVASFEIVRPATAGETDDAFDHLEAGYSFDQFRPVELTDIQAEAAASSPQNESENPPISSASSPDGHEPSRARFPMILLSVIEAQTQHRHLIKGFLSANGISCIYGPSNSSKTFLALDMALSIASGRPWQGRPVRQGRVIYIAAEGAHSVINRAAAYREEYLEGNVDVPFFLVPSPVNLLMLDEDVSPLISQLEGLAEATSEDCALVIFDTLARSMAGGDENGPGDMTTVVDNLGVIQARLGCAVLVVHHTGKSEQAGMRGHSSLLAAVDTALEVSNAGDRLFTVTAKKQRDLECGAQATYSLRPVEIGTDLDGEPVTTCIPEPTDEIVPTKSSKLSSPERLVVTAMEDLLSHEKGHLAPDTVLNEPSNKLLPDQEVVSELDLRELSIARGVSGSDKPDSQKRAFRRALQGLQAKGKIQVFEEFVWFRTSRAWPDNRKMSGSAKSRQPDRPGHPPIGVSGCPDVRFPEDDVPRSEPDEPMLPLEAYEEFTV